MDKLVDAVDWLGGEWLRFLVWFSIGLFLLPIGVSTLTGWINLDRFYDGLVPGNMNIGVVMLVTAPYLIYLVYRIVQNGHSKEQHAQEAEFF